MVSVLGLKLPGWNVKDSPAKESEHRQRLSCDYARSSPHLTRVQQIRTPVGSQGLLNRLGLVGYAIDVELDIRILQMENKMRLHV